MDEYPYHLMVKEDEPACGARDDKALTYRVDVANCPACLRSSLRAAEREANRRAAQEWNEIINRLNDRVRSAERRAEGLEEALVQCVEAIGRLDAPGEHVIECYVGIGCCRPRLQAAIMRAEVALSVSTGSPEEGTK